MFTRLLDVRARLQHRSAFLLGPRQTGKSTLVRSAFGPEALFIDLLDPRMAQTLQRDPARFEDLVRPHLAQGAENNAPRIVVVDEIQRNPALLNSVHRLIECYPQGRFLLTGSSARRLKTESTNLLGGRARLLRMHPLCSAELASEASAAGGAPLTTWRDLIARTGLPGVVHSPEWSDDLVAYADVYLREEIQMEARLRNLDAFSRFLTVAAGANGHQIIFEKIGARAGVSAKVCKSYFELLDHTLVAELIPSFKETVKRQPVAAPKLYFFDTGIVRSLQGRERSDALEFGEDLETYLLHEMRCYRDYRSVRFSVSYWRSKNQSEVDFVLSSPNAVVAIEVKTSRRLTGHDFAGLKALGEENIPMRRILVNPFTVSGTRENGVEIFSVDDFLTQLWKGKIV